MKTIKLLTLALLTSSTLTFGQEDNKSFGSRTSYLINPKIGFSTLNLDEYGKIEGQTTQVDITLNTMLNKSLELQYGFGFTEFKANNSVTDANSVSRTVDNKYFRLPVTLNYIKKYNNMFSSIMGFGFYGSYLYKCNIPPYFQGNNQGVSLGCSISLGSDIKFDEKNGLRLQFEFQRDLTKIKTNGLDFSQKLTNTNLVSLAFMHKF